jgi:ribosomal protein S18 acetylase RimI-like enzyme
MADVAWSDPVRKLTLHATREVSTPLVDLLSRTEWGTREVKYRIRGVGRILEHIKDPHFLLLEQGDRLVGAVVASRKSVGAGAKTCDALFIAMIVVDASMKGSGYGTLLAARAREYGRALLRKPGIIYLFVETTNTASVRVHEKIGYRRIGQFEARIFTRIFPRDNREVRRPSAAERVELADLLEHQYAGHALLDVRDAVERGRYFVLRSGKEMVAGAQVRPMHWSLKELRGLGGTLAMKVLPSLPLIRRGYSPEHLRFLQIGNIWFRPGHEAALSVLLEALLARCGVHVGILFLDRRSAVHTTISSHVRFGAFSRLVVETAEVFADFIGCSSDEVAGLSAAPINVSPVDPM